MSLTPEWRGRVDHWQNTLKTLFFVPVADVPLAGRVTAEQLTPAQARQGTFQPTSCLRMGVIWMRCSNVTLAELSTNQ